MMHQMRLDGGADFVKSTRSEEFQQAAAPPPEAGKDALWQHVPGMVTDSEGGQYWRGRQLPMFLSAREIYHHLNMIDQHSPDRRKLMVKKYGEASQLSRQRQSATGEEVSLPSLLDHLKGQQFNLDRPLPVGFGPTTNAEGAVINNRITLKQGHHRVAAALAHMPDKPLPVQQGKTHSGDEMDSAIYRVGSPQEYQSFQHLPQNPTGFLGGLHLYG